MKQSWLGLICLSGVAAACADDVRIHTFTRPELGTDGSVSSYWIETSQSIVVVDGLRTLGDARAGVSELQKLGKPIAAIFVTHPHPDHIGGLGVFADAQPDAPIYASEVSDREIAEDTQGLLAVARSQGLDFPETFTRPTAFVHDGETLKIDGVTFVVHERGPSESVAATSLEIPALDVSFEGDVVSNHMTVALLEGRIDAWLQQLDRLRSELSPEAIVYPGHGNAGLGRALVDSQKQYLEDFKQWVVDNRSASGEVDDAGKQIIRTKLSEKYPDYPFVAAGFDGLIEANIDAVAKGLDASP